MIRAVTHQEIDFESLGGAGIHGEVSGVAHLVAGDEAGALDDVQWLLSYLPQNNLDTPSYVPTSDEGRPTPRVSRVVLPDDPQHPYDVRAVIEGLVDEGVFLEIQRPRMPGTS